MFVFAGIPCAENDKCSDIAGAKIHIWVMDKDHEVAKIRAINYIEDTLWKITNLEHDFSISPEQLDNLHESEYILYKKALEFGIAADFLAYPKKQSDNNGSF